jgi:hypothetical protein
MCTIGYAIDCCWDDQKTGHSYLRHWTSAALSSWGQSTSLASFWAFSSGRLMLAHQQRALPDRDTALTQHDVC